MWKSVAKARPARPVQIGQAAAAPSICSTRRRGRVVFFCETVIRFPLNTVAAVSGDPASPRWRRRSTLFSVTSQAEDSALQRLAQHLECEPLEIGRAHV